MVAQTIMLPHWNWLVKVFYEVEPMDAKRITRILKDAGCKGVKMLDAKRKLRQCIPDTGFTFSSMNDHCSVVMLCRTTCADEFANSFDHEKRHLSINIADAYGIDIHSEEFAYLAGEIAQQMFRVARRFMCDCCRKRR